MTDDQFLWAFCGPAIAIMLMFMAGWIWYNERLEQREKREEAIQQQERGRGYIHIMGKHNSLPSTNELDS